MIGRYGYIGSILVLPHHVDIHVGKRVRHRRWLVGMTQGELADALGIRFQQVQKYESGTNRISASRLWDISKALDVSISYFFEDIEEPEVDADTDGFDELFKTYRNLSEDRRRRLQVLAQELMS